MKIDFFRICQEALTNVMYHSLANNVEISIEQAGNTIALTITDHGTGFTPDEQIKGHGLARMSERAISINGQLDISSEAGKGTRICLTIPNDQA